MLYYRLFSIFFIFILLCPLLLAQEENIISTPSPIPEGTEPPEEKSNNKIINFWYLIIIIISLFFLAVFFILFKIRKKLREGDSLRKPLTGLASRHAGMIDPDDISRG